MNDHATIAGPMLDEPLEAWNWGTVIVDDTRTVRQLWIESPGGHASIASACLRPGDRITAGRHPGADIHVPSDALMSRQHFTLECAATHGVLRDLESVNGTFLNGMRVREAKVHDRDKITAGETSFTVAMGLTKGKNHHRQENDDDDDDA